jgi:galactonate dehydratase
MIVTAIETVTLGSVSPMPALLFVQIHTDEGLTGLGETHYLPDACREVVHRDIAPSLLGTDPTAVEGKWREMYDAYCRIAGRGAEIRALSAVDVALWDILGKTAGKPIFALLGGPCWERLPIYNTCGSPRYASGKGPIRAGSGSTEHTELYDDVQGFLTRPGELAKELLAENIDGMKIWPFDRFARRSRGMRIDQAELRQGVEPVRLIREAVGDAMRIMVDGHGLWSLAPALEIARALEPFGVTWVEDFVMSTDMELLQRFHDESPVPVCASEYLVGRAEYLGVLQRKAAEVVMVDPTWAGGITESHKIAILADTFGLPVTLHDCTGPVTLMAGVQLGFAATNLLFQETVRGFNRTFYPDLVDGMPTIEGNSILAPTAPGLGMSLHPSLAHDPHTVWQRSEL